jgi:pyruvate dehydrogenase E2 component (dihydrolipoamide acetyltransferase)
MKEKILMPKMGESVMEGTLIKWHKNIGDKVAKDEILFEISTDKVDTEVPSPVDGVLAEIFLNENETAEVGSLVATVTVEGTEEAENIEENESVKEEIVNEELTSDDSDLVDIQMPKMGESVMEGTILKWDKIVGDKIEKDEILFEISTDKVDTEVPSPVDGVVSEILFDENETVEVGVVVARISVSGKVHKKKASVVTNEVQEVEPQTSETLKKSETPPSKSNRFYSPLVMNIASKENISFDELETINGSGSNGRVTKKDILAYIADKKTGKRTKTNIQTSDVPSPKLSQNFTGREQVIPMDNIRKRIKDHMLKSRDTSVHVSEMIEVDMTRIHNFINKNKKKFLEEDNTKLTYMAFVSYAVVKALKEYPLMNASIDGENIIMKKYVNLGIAVAVEPNGLIVPNIKNADSMNVRGLAKAIQQLSFNARNKKLSPDDVVGGTFSLTNYGVFGSLFGTPIINQPELGILGIGAVVKRPVVIETEQGDVIGIKPIMMLSLSHDHRLVDGMLGGLFIKYVKEALENFYVETV